MSKSRKFIITKWLGQTLKQNCRTSSPGAKFSLPGALTQPLMVLQNLFPMIQLYFRDSQLLHMLCLFLKGWNVSPEVQLLFRSILNIYLVPSFLPLVSHTTECRCLPTHLKEDCIWPSGWKGCPNLAFDEGCFRHATLVHFLKESGWVVARDRYPMQRQKWNQGISRCTFRPSVDKV